MPVAKQLLPEVRARLAARKPRQSQVRIIAH